MLKTLLFLLLGFCGSLSARELGLETLRGRVVFEAQTDRMVVGWRDGRNLEQQAAQLSGMKDVNHPPLDRVVPRSAATLIRLTRFQSDLEADELAENLLVSDDIDWVAPLLVLSGETYTPSDEIRIGTTDDGLTAQEIDEFGLAGIRRLGDGTFVVTRPRASALEVIGFCNQLIALETVLWCEPLWLEGHPLNHPAPVDTPRVVIHRSGEDVILNWQWCGDVSYEVWSSIGQDAPHFEAMLNDTHFTDEAVLNRQACKMYEVRAIPRGR